MNRRMDDNEVALLVRRTYQATRVPALTQPALRTSLEAVVPVRRRWALPVAVAVGVAVLLGGVALVLRVGTNRPDVVSVASGAPSASVSPRTSVLTPDEQALQNQISLVVHRIDDLAGVRDAAYDVAVFDIRARRLTIYRADSVPERRSTLYRPLIPGGISVQYAKALLSVKERNQLATVVRARQDDLRKRQGIQITGYGDEDTPGGRFVIGYDPSFTKPQDADLRPFEKYGAGTVVFKPDEPITGWQQG